MKRIKTLLGIALGLAVVLGSCSKEYGHTFENGYNSGEYEDTVTVDIDTNRFKIDYSKYTQARLFPGLVGAEEPRLENFLVQIDLNYEEIRSSDLRISVAPGNWQSTGVYAPAGELIVIDVPQGVYGLTAQISPHVSTSVEGIDFPRRDAEIFNRQTIFPGKNYMRNLYGGLVYILPARPLGRIVDLHFSGVAKAPSFKLNGPGATTNEEWKTLVENTTVPWFELEGDRMVFTLETEKLKKYPIEDPTLLMETWDKSIREGYWDWTGLTEGNPDIRHRAPFNKWRIVHDVLFKPGVAQVSGYPVRAGNTDSYFRQATTVEDVKFANWGTYHELGHNMQMGSTWSFAGNGEVTNNLFHFRVAKIYGDQSYKIAEVWNKAVPYIAETKSKDGAMNWAAMDVDGNAYKSTSHDVRLMMWAQIFEKYGYDFMTYIYKRGREARFTSANDQSKVDFFYEALSEFTETDMEPYLNRGWGLYPSAVSKRYVSETKGFPLLSRQVWHFNPVTGTGGDEFILDQDRFVSLPKAGWSVTASNYNTGYVPNNMIDGDITKFWNSCWGSSRCSGASHTSPTWTVDLTLGTSSIAANGIIFHQRQVENSNNHIRRLNLQISLDGTNWEDLGSRELTRSLSAQYLFFNENNLGQQRNVRFVRLKIERPNLYNTSDYPVIAELGMFTY